MGRIGLQHHGVTRGGALDTWSLQWANAVLGNPRHAAALEVSFGGLQFEAMIETRVAIGGTPVEATINDEAVNLWQPLRLRPGDRVALSAQAARRNYLAVQGGFTTAQVLGSRAMTLREGLGGLGDGLQAKPVRTGDLLPCADSLPEPEGQQLPADTVASPASVVRVVPNVAGRNFPREMRQAYFGSSYTISPRSDRMGCRLSGAEVLASTAPDASFAVLPGCIQVPPDGQPIILLADCQTMGGYPVIGTVIAADLPALGRCIPGDVLRFQPVTPDAARRAWNEHTKGLPPKQS